jgi:hypothetical protein
MPPKTTPPILLKRKTSKDMLYGMSHVFETDNGFQFNVAPNNPKNPAGGYKIEPGECFAMSVDWARQTLLLGLLNNPDVLTPAKWHIMQSAYEIRDKGDQFVFKGSGLAANKVVDKDLPSVFAIPTSLLAQPDGVYVVSTSGDGGAHAMGFAHKDQTLDYLDPNFGLMRTTDTDAFKMGLVRLFQDHYKDIVAELEVFKVTLA